MNFEQYILPTFLAPYLINGESDTLTDEEIKTIEAFETDQLKEFRSFYCIDVEESNGFTASFSMDISGFLACDCSLFTFDIGELYATEEEVFVAWRRDILPGVVSQYSIDDLPALCESFNNYTDFLCKDGVISENTYNNISHPKECK